LFAPLTEITADKYEIVVEAVVVIPLGAALDIIEAIP
jgi:hypothetical protein